MLLPSESEEHEVLQTGSIHVAIPPSFLSFTIVHFKCLNCAPIWVVKIRNTSEAVLLVYPLAIILSAALWALVSIYVSLGEYCDPHTASSVFLILLLFARCVKGLNKMCEFGNS